MQLYTKLQHCDFIIILTISAVYHQFTKQFETGRSSQRKQFFCGYHGD